MLIGDPTDRVIINGLQGGFPLTERPFRDAGHELGLSEGELIEGVRHLIDTGRLSRFGPLWNAEGLGGDVCLCAMAVPAARFETLKKFAGRCRFPTISFVVPMRRHRGRLERGERRCGLWCW